MLMLTGVLMFSLGTSLALFSANPSLIIVWLVGLSMNVGLLLGVKSSSWMFFAVILLFTGGMMVLFSYMLTLVSSTKITFFSPGGFALSAWGVLAITFVSGEKLIVYGLRVSDLYNLSQNLILFLLALYLLVALTVVVKLALNFSGALKVYSTNEL